MGLRLLWGDAIAGGQLDQVIVLFQMEWQIVARGTDVERSIREGEV